MTLPKNKSILIALVIAAAITLWLLSGIFKSDEPVVSQSVISNQEQKLVKVLIATKKAVEHANVITIYGQTDANRTVELKAQTSGQIKEVLIEKGSLVKKGDIIARLKMDDRQRRLKSAQSSVRHRQLEFEASRKLSQKSYRSQTKLAEAESLLHAAKAELKIAELDIQHIALRAPFDGKLEDKTIEVGNYVGVGDMVAKFIDLSPIIITAEVPENAISTVKEGQIASAVLTDGRTIDGIIRFVASTSDKTTRTYRVEMEAENPQHDIPVGQTAKLRLKVGTHAAYLLSPSILTLSDQGVIGVKTLNETDEVQFNPVQLLEDTQDGVWVSGLAQSARIILRGQEYVKAGQKVIAMEEDNDATKAQDE
ncbi:putative RND family efflux transporter MFP subunit [Candidatus Terasakiella magnetica]|uniref:Putative RND family efflux transporter MFP subunit n=1 Tax=Candidatus Terasakiella magnetica TaxID=1867952 RepID=A0A1C3RK70_9PROT|nr:efflux RND transporter periplasmic adaptor subunit [Candidatus Terasakiella magnetica]SCA57710.1 putative RND family efflux transporter MFP subunit [Candidatus Terasakiella magnetica]